MTYGITMRKPSELVPYAKNSRTHSAEQVKQVMRSIEEFGFTNPILTHGKTIIAGHCRLEAAKKLGYTEVPTIALDGLTKEQARAYVIADNKLALNAGWDDGILKDEIESLLSVDYAIDLLGFTDEELKDLGVGVEEPDDHSGDPDEVPEVPQNIHGVKRGDVWQLGDHRLMCGDSTSEADVATLMNGEKADMVFTDPPYGIGYEYAHHDDSDSEQNTQLVSKVFQIHKCGKVWTPGLMNLARDIERFGKTKVAVWYKKFAQAGSGIGGASTWEPILIINPTNKKLPNDVIVISTEREKVGDTDLRQLHSCPKPVQLYEHLIECLSNDNERLFEPFCGSGTTLIASEKTGRKCYGMEIDPHYCSVIIERWQQFTNKKAIRLEGE